MRLRSCKHRREHHAFLCMEGRVHLCSGLRMYNLPMRWCRRALERYPGMRFDVLCLMGEVAERARRPEEAILYYRQAHEIDPTNASACWYLGCVYESMRQLENAIGWCEKALELSRDEDDKEFTDHLNRQIQLLRSQLPKS
jgi:tetratricopeptide (TPR) repeat protein